MSDNILQRLASEASILLESVQEVTASADAFLRFTDSMGWTLPDWPKLDFPAIAKAVSSLVDAIGALSKGLKTEQLKDIVDAASALADAFSGLETLLPLLEAGIGSKLPADAPKAFADDALQTLLLRYMRKQTPHLYEVLRLLAVIQPETATEITFGKVGLRKVHKRPRLRFEHLMALLRDPIAHLQHFYLPSGNLNRAGDARALVATLGSTLQPMVQGRGGMLIYGTSGLPQSSWGDAALEPLTRSALLSLPIPMDLDTLAAGGEISLGLEVLHKGKKGALGLPGPALELTPKGLVTVNIPANDWNLGLTVSGDPGTFYISESTFKANGKAGANLDLDLVATLGAGSANAFCFGADGGTRLQVGELELSAMARLSATPDYGFGLALKDAAFVLAAGDGDSFIAKVLPKDGITFDFDLGLAWSKRGGLQLSGGVGLEVRVPLDITLFNALTLYWIDLALALDAEGLTFEAGITASLNIGPIAGSIENIGLRTGLSFPESGKGNLGSANLSFGLRPPDGFGIAIDAGVVSGGGYLYCDPDEGRYAGVAALSFAAFGLTAVGILTTKLPGGKEGWSLYLSVVADFTPIQLGYGFTLNGVGGFIGIHRTFDPDALAEGLSNGRLDSIMFPDDPIANAVKLLQDVEAVFPIAQGNYVFGPLVKLGWGTPTVISAELGLVLSIPDFTIAVIGQIDVLLPVPEAAVISLHLATMGVIEIPEATFWVMASLFDSKIAIIDVSGDMAMYARFTGTPFFLMSVGGFHPDYSPPSGLPSAMYALRRMTAAPDFGKNVTVRLQAYFAVTANSLQFGADLFAEASVEVVSIDFRAAGWFGFDVLITFSPFAVIADARAGVTITASGKELMGVDLALHLEGPKPWYVSGRAEFKMLGFKVPFKFEIGSKQGRVPLEPYDILPDLLEALREPKSWGPLAGSSSRPLAALRELNPTVEEGLWLSPEGSLEVRQTVVPLNKTLDRYGEFVPKDEDRFEIEGAGIGTDTSETDVIQDWFAPAQFTVMSEAKRLSSPSFESMDCGVSFGADGVEVTETAAEIVTFTPDYEQAVLETSRRVGLGIGGLRTGALGRAGLLGKHLEAREGRAGGVAGAGNGPGLKAFSVQSESVKMRASRFAVVGANSGAEIGKIAAGARTFSEVEAALTRHLEKNPSKRGTLKIVPEHAVKGG